MKFDPQLLQVLKNFSTINKSILFKPGNTISTLAPGKTIIAKAKVDNEITDEFAIFDIPQLLGVLSMFTEPEVEVTSNSLLIKNGNEVVRYKFAALETIVYPTKDITMPSVDVEFDLSQEVLGRLLKATAVLGCPEVVIKGENGKLSVGSADSSDTTKDAMTIEVGDTDKTFKMFIKLDNLKMVPGSYHVVVSGSQKIKVVEFSNDTFTYWVVVEAKPSTWE